MSEKEPQQEPILPAEKVEQSSQEKAIEEFNKVHGMLSEVYEMAAGLEKRLVELAQKGGFEYTPENSGELSSGTQRLIAKLEAETPQNPTAVQPIEMGQVILEPRRPYDGVSAEAFKNTARPLASTHSRVTHVPINATQGEELLKLSGWNNLKPDQGNALPWLGKDAEKGGPTAATAASGELPKAQGNPDLENGYYFEGKKVTVARVNGTPDTEGTTIEIVDEDGNTNTVDEKQLESNFFNKAGKEIELYTGSEKAKNWFSRAREKYGIHYWNAKWMGIKDGIASAYDKVLNTGVNSETMSEGEQEKKRQKNRTVMLVGVGVIGGLAIGSLVTAGIMNASHSHDASEAAANLPPADTHSGSPGIPDHLKGVLDGESAQGGTGVLGENAPTLPSFEVDTNSNYNIANTGIGGEQLFTRLGIDPRKFYENQDTLLKMSNGPGGAFYQNPGEPVQLNANGWMPPEVQKFIDTLKQ